MSRTVFTGKSFQEATQKALSAGYQPVGQARNKNGTYVVFAEKVQFGQVPQPQQFFNAEWLRGKI